MIISIVTATLNASRYLGQCIDSVRSNSRPGVEAEHIIVDGGSTDETIEIAHAKGVRLITGKDAGIYDALNRGSFAASGILLGCLGADDMLLDGALAAIAKEYGRGQPRWICGGVRYIDGSDNYLGTLSAPPHWTGHRIFTSLGWSCLSHQAVYFAREFFEELGGFNLDFKVAGDYDLIARAFSRCPYRRIRKALAVSRITGMNFATIHEVRGSSERTTVTEAFAPKPAMQRLLYRTALKTWLCAANPMWYVRKRRGWWVPSSRSIA